MRDVARLSADSPGSPPGRQLLLDAVFAAGEVAPLRRRITRYAVAAGLDEQATDDFVLAVNEAMSNAIRHGGGEGVVRLWQGDDLLCEVADHGPGFSTGAPTVSRRRPEPSPSGGLGLWLVQQLCDSFDIDSGPEGTTIRVGAALPDPVTGPRRSTPGRDDGAPRHR